MARRHPKVQNGGERRNRAGELRWRQFDAEFRTPPPITTCSYSVRARLRLQGNLGAAVRAVNRARSAHQEPACALQQSLLHQHCRL
eukprot:6206087-Pleurochrysis_carterae.AAC.1